MDEYFITFREMISLRGLTDHTVKSYSTYIRAYLDYLNHVLHKMPADVSWNELRDYIRFIQKERGLSDRTVNAAISQLRFFTIYVLHNMRIHITHTKGRSDRYAILSKTALDLLTQYWFTYGKPMNWLFPKQFKKDSDKPIDTFYLSRHIHAHEQELGWEQKLTCHSFRHAFGTHLYEHGTDLLTIKALLGHKSLHSTTIYVHLSNSGIHNTVSPLDRLAGELNV